MFIFLVFGVLCYDSSVEVSSLWSPEVRRWRVAPSGSTSTNAPCPILKVLVQWSVLIFQSWVVKFFFKLSLVFSKVWLDEHWLQWTNKISLPLVFHLTICLSQWFALRYDEKVCRWEKCTVPPNFNWSAPPEANRNIMVLCTFCDPENNVNDKWLIVFIWYKRLGKDNHFITSISSSHWYTQE